MTSFLSTTNKYNFGGRGISFFKSMKNFDHNDLVKCRGCELKFAREEMIIFAGHHMCKYCMKDMEKHLSQGAKICIR